MEWIKYIGRMSDADVAAQRLWDLVYAYDAAYDRAARKVGLSAAQACLLRAVAGAPRTMGALASELLCDASNVTQLTSRLLGRGLVERVTAADDRRSKHVIITAAGRAADRRIRAAFDFPRVRIATLTSDEQAVLARLLGTLLAHDGDGDDDPGGSHLMEPPSVRPC